MRFINNHPVQSRVFQAFLSTWAFMKVARLGTGNIFTLLLFLFILLFYRTVDQYLTHSGKDKSSDTGKKSNIVAFILAFLFACLYLMIDGNNLVADLSNRLFRTGVLAVCFVGILLLFYKALQCFFVFACKKETISHYLLKNNEKFPFYRKHILWITTLICFFCWLPMFLYQFPGILTPDSINQVEQVLGLIPYSNHHPWVHTLLIKLFYQIGSIFSSDLTVALSFYTVAQMILFALSIGYLLSTCVYFEVNTWICVGITAFFTLVPYHAVYAVTLWKDILFAATVLCFCCSLLRISDKCAKLHGAIYFFSCILFCLLRSNGWYGFLLCLPLLIYHFRKQWKWYVPLHLLAVIIVLLIKIPVMNSLQVQQPDFVESLCIPLQQIANVICHDRELSPQQIKAIDTVIEDRNLVKELYVPTFADNIKELVRAGNPEYLEANKGTYFKLWFQLLCQYPGDYIEAYINQTYGYWYPDIFYVVADNEGISPNTTIDIQSRPLIRGPVVIKCKEIFLKLYTMIPLYGLVWCIGFMGWLLLLLIGTAIVRQENEKIVYYFPCLALVLTILIATPVASDFRYVYFLFVTMPLYLIIGGL